MIYIHKNLIKKAKRDKQLIDLILVQLEDVIATALVIKEGMYKGKLCGKYGLILDMPIESDCYVLWETIEDKTQFELSSTIYEYEEQEIERLIAGNQFIKLEAAWTDMKDCLLQLLESKQLELKYVLDEQQTFILAQTQNYVNIAYTGNAGSGKTLLLNRIAHDLLALDQPFLYLTYSTSLKEKFSSFLSDAIEPEKEPIAHIYTFEQLLREHIAPYYQLEATHYVSFLLCEQFVKVELAKVEQELGLKTLLSVKELARVLMTLPTFDLDIHDPKKKLAVPSVMIQRKLSSLVEAKKASVTEDDRKILGRLSVKFEADLKKKKLKSWYIFLNDLNIAVSKKVYDKPYAYILLDEMQDLGQFEFMLLIKLLRNNSTTRYILTYDENQRIAFEGSTDRSFQKRIEQLNIEPTILQYNYRNAANIKKLASYFVTEQERQGVNEQSNLNLSKVKVVINADMDHFITQLVTKFIPEENLNIGIVAFGQTYTQYYDHFYTSEGKSKYIGIDFYNEEDIKGLEYTNLIILNFFELCKLEKVISQMELRKWYVAITRACDNLLIHVNSEDEYEYAKKQLKQDFFGRDYIESYDVFEDCLEHFNKDILISLGNEQKNILAQEGHRLLKEFLKSYSLDLLDEAVSVFKQIDMEETLKNLLEIEFPTLQKQEAAVALELCKIAISEQQRELFAKYVAFVHVDFQWQLELLMTESDLQWQDLFVGEMKSKKVVYDELKAKGKALKMDRRYDDYIALYYRYGVYRNITQTYEELQTDSLQKQTYVIIARAYLKQGLEEKAMKLYIQQGNLDEVLRYYNATGKYDVAFEELYQLLDQQTNPRYVELLFEIAVKTKEQKEVFLQRLLMVKELTVTQRLKILYELYLLAKEQQYAEQAITLATEHKMDEFILRFYYRNRALAVQFPIIAEVLRKAKRFRELAQLYNEQANYGQELLALVWAYRQHSQNLEGQIVTLTKDIVQHHIQGDFTTVIQEVLPEILAIMHDNVHYHEQAVEVLLYIQAIDKAITLAYEYELYEFVVLIAETHKQVTEISLVAKAYEHLENFGQAAILHKEAGRVHHAISMMPDIEQKQIWIKEQFDKMLPQLIAQLSELQQVREKCMLELIEKDFSYSGKTNAHLYAEQVLQEWLKLTEQLRPLDHLLIDSTEAAAAVIEYFTQECMTKEVITYYKQQAALCQHIPILVQVLEAVMEEKDPLLELEVRSILLELQLKSLTVRDIESQEKVWLNLQRVLELSTFHKIADFTNLFKLLVKHQSYMPQALQAMLVHYICLIEQIELRKKTTVTSMKKHLSGLTQRSFFNFLNEFPVDTAPLLVQNLLVETLILLSEQKNKLLTEEKNAFLKALSTQKETERKWQETKSKLIAHQEYGRLYAETHKLLNAKEAVELLPLYMQELEDKYGERLKQKKSESAPELIFRIEQEIYHLLTDFVKTQDDVAIQNQIRRRKRTHNQDAEKIGKVVIDLQRRLDEETAITIRLQNSFEQSNKFFTDYFNQYRKLWYWKPKQIASVNFEDLEPDMRHPLFKEYIEFLLRLNQQTELEEKKETDLQVELKEKKETDLQVELKEKEETDLQVELKEKEETDLQVELKEKEETDLQVELKEKKETVLQVKLEETEESSSLEGLDPIKAERVRVLQDLADQDTLDAPTLSMVTKLPLDVVELYMMERERFMSYRQLVPTLSREQLVLLSEIQPLSFEDLELLCYFYVPIK